MITTIYISEMEAANTSTTSQDPDIFSTPNNFDNLSAKKWKSKTLEKAQGKWIHIKGKIFLFYLWREVLLSFAQVGVQRGRTASSPFCSRLRWNREQMALQLSLRNLTHTSLTMHRAVRSWPWSWVSQGLDLVKIKMTPKWNSKY